ncbi:uncharacterized protein N7484_002901 [Penicillium longicatenatum]|uniref:uncharacterized protein n=1 Tax=Penicillium longicatenatum TaxID=1561947 RepID=UPI0025499EC2|nr:uncharacterized protein N7484_002901 [Penicillium longicatenatum]KAJ5649178.1 hypothetical protein N7484_002901 [Penicillium longicatenatum]
MLVKNILAVFAIAGMAAAYPAEEVETDLEERGYCEKDSNSWCCKNIVPFSILFFDGVGSDCKHPGNDGCKYGSSPLCCHKGQIVSNGKDGSQVVCLKK